jgi:diguanylate cyclase (GGDEF)-like protein/PAS domain S-box-containing protein
MSDAMFEVKGKSLLIVEDSVIEAMRLEGISKQLGMNVVGSVSTESEAIKKTCDLRPDIVLMDINLGHGGSGIKAARKISDEMGIPIVYTTSYSDSSTVFDAIKAQPYGYIVKPYSDAQLVVAVGVALERRAIENKAFKTGEQLKIASQTAYLSLFEIQSDGETISFSDEKGLFNIPRKMHKADFLDLFPSDVAQNLDKAIEAGEPLRIKTQIQGESEQARFISVLLTEKPEQEPMIRVGAIQDITEFQEVENELLVSDTILEDIKDGVAVIDEDFKITRVNAAFCQLFDVTFENVKDKNLRNLLKLNRATDKDIDFNQDGFSEQLCISSTTVTDHHVLMSTHKVSRDKPFSDLVVCTFTDITSLKQNESRLAEMAFIDPLTNAANRHLLKSKFETISREKIGFGIVFIDLDDFKIVNDTYGHETGDEILIACAERLFAVIREQDVLVRYGGDEFIILIHDPDKQALEKVAERICSTLSKVYDSSKGSLKVSASIGVSEAMQASHALNALTFADKAMYKAKQTGKGKVIFFNEALTKEIDRYHQLQEALSVATERRDFVPFFQPIVDRTGRVVAVEALARWHHHELGTIPPDEFIEIAEEMGLIDALGFEIIRKTCVSLKLLEKLDIKDIAFHINLSTIQLLNNKLCGRINEQLNTFGVSREKIVFEVTETSIKSAQAYSMIQELRQSGYEVLVDDFGKGYTGIPDLQSPHYTGIKLDRSLLPCDKNKKHTQQIIISHLVPLFSELNLSSTLEGVETEEQLELGLVSGCEHFQGYYFAKPLNIQELVEFLSQHSDAALQKHFSKFAATKARARMH